MKNKRNVLYSLIIMLTGLIYFPAQAQQKQAESVIPSFVQHSVVRAIKQDKKGNIWLASPDGIIRYDGKSFTNITSKVMSARFFSVLEDRKGNFWFASAGSGVYYYDGKSFRNFTTRDGLASNSVTYIYEDKTGIIWFGTGGGASCYDPSATLRTGSKSFRNFKTKNGLSINSVNSIIEDKTGKFWFGIRGNACIYDGKTVTVLMHEGKPFKNVQSIIEDKKGNIWLGGADGLWRYDGSTFTNFSQKAVGCICEDKKGNIWTTERVNGQTFNSQAWTLSRYDGKSLSSKKPTRTEITNTPMISGILEANDGSIWFAGGGVYRYDGKTITDFKGK